HVSNRAVSHCILVPPLSAAGDGVRPSPTLALVAHRAASFCSQGEPSGVRCGRLNAETDYCSEGRSGPPDAGGRSFHLRGGKREHAHDLLVLPGVRPILSRGEWDDGVGPSGILADRGWFSHPKSRLIALDSVETWKRLAFLLNQLPGKRL